MRNNKIFNRIGFIYRAVISIFFIFSASNFLFSQEDIEKNSSLRVFITPSALVNWYPGLQAGVEYRINNWSLITEFGYIIPPEAIPEDFQSEKITDYSGFRIKAAVRRKFNKYFFMELNYYHRRIDKIITDDFLRHNGLYIEEMDYEIKNILNGLALTAGVEFKFTEKWYMDIGGGLGLGMQNRLYSSLPPDVIPASNRTFFWGSRSFSTTDIKNESYPILVVNFRIKYSIF